jgi:hypothetical protein
MVARRDRRENRLKVLWLIAALLALAIVALAILKKRVASDGSGGAWPFYLKRLLSSPEQVLYHRLVGALPDHVVLAQVQVSRVLGVKKGFDFHHWNNRINRLSYDFVVCRKDATVLAAIELDDATHESKSRARTDEKKDRATSAANLKLVRWHVKALPDADGIRAAIGSIASVMDAEAPTRDGDAQELSRRRTAATKGRRDGGPVEPTSKIEP